MLSQYLLVPVTTLILTLYLFSLLLKKADILTRNIHRKIWNTILLIAFLVSAFIGIIAVIKINYKISIPGYDELINWHVNFGIALFLTGVIHFTWHFKYYFNFFSREKDKTVHVIKNDNLMTSTNISKRQFRIYVFILGFTAMTSQIIFIREFLSVFNGNELILGIILANWMFLTGFGAYVGKFQKNTRKLNFRLIFFLLILMPIILVFLIYVLKNLLFPIGIQAGIFKIFYISLLLLFPFCFLSGYLFTILAGTLSSYQKANIINRAYAIESIGSIAGGFVFSFFLVLLFNTFQSLAIIMAINCVLLIIIMKNTEAIKKIGYLVSGLLLIISVFIFNLDQKTKQLLFENQNIKYNEDTPFGNITVTMHGDQYNFYENNTLIFNTANPIKSEEAVHFSMLQHHSPQNVLLISGGFAGMTNEILKYNIENLTYLEMNKWLIKAGEKFHSAALKHDKIRIINQDPRLFLNSGKEKYDVVIMDFPQPVNYKINRFYTLDFFKGLKENLSSGAIILTGLMPSANYLASDEKEVNSILYHTLKQVFQNVLILPGEKNYFIASDGNLKTNIAELVESSGIENTYVNQYYVDDFYLKQRSGFLLSNVNTEARINRDFYPHAFLSQTKLWLSKFKGKYWIITGLSLILFLFILIRIKKINFGLFTAGFTSSALEVVIMISFQILYGYLYLMTGFIFTAFMAGLIAGSLLAEKIIPVVKKIHYQINQLLMAFISLLLAFSIHFFDQHHGHIIIIHVVFIMLTLITGFATGSVFFCATRLSKTMYGHIAAYSYSADMFGSAFGAFLATIFLIPVIGIIEVCYVTASLNILSMLIVRFSVKNP